MSATPTEPVTEATPRQGSSRRETEDQANQPGRLAGTLLLLRDLWRLLRGEDQRGRKVRWLLGLLRPYRMQVLADDASRCWSRPRPRSRRRTSPARAIDNGIKAGDESTR